MKITKKAFTLLELVLYTGILAFSSVVLVSILFSGIEHNTKTTLFLEQSRNITTTQKHLDKATENINNIVLLSHKKVNTNLSDIEDITINPTNYNQHSFSIAELQTKCGFITSDRYDIVAFTSKDGLDPIVIGVIKGNTLSGREYYQLAVYKYYSLFYEKERIEEDENNANISSYLDSQSKLVTEGLTNYKCNKENGFLTPISAKYYIDEDYDYTTTTFLSGFKVIPYGIDNFSNDIVKYGVGMVEFELDWETREKERSSTLYQSFSKTFNY